ncbi:4-hydroxy-tetrahydrodipicolinate reductase [Candidatus Gracilibacteria bacterium]|nr:4-hydroxy-tetrahydrodipicolinate reductase [Candidatus Gracilibacteria bacterium]
MKIALIGYGNMGKEVERVALERGHEVSQEIEGADVVVDFSLGDAVMENIKKCGDIPMVIGTTGWEVDEVGKACAGKKVLWSWNFSIGVNLYYRIVEETAKLMNKFEEYDVWGSEIHHSNKADSPSGTAKVLGDILVSELDRKDSVVTERLDRKREDGEIHFSSVRGGAVNFAHTIGFDSEADTITVTHAARNRGGYALGAVKAAEWLVAQENGFYSMNDFLWK